MVELQSGGMREGVVWEFTIPEWKDLFSMTYSEVNLKTWGPMGCRDMGNPYDYLPWLISRNNPSGSFSLTYIFGNLE